MIKRIIYLNIIFFSLISVNVAFASTTLSYQSKLLNASNTPVTVATPITFSIYNSSTTGSYSGTASASGPLLWTDTFTVTPDTNGYFNVELGSGTEFPSYLTLDSNNFWIGVKVSSDSEATPRLRYSPSPFSVNSGKVNNLTASSTALANSLLALDSLLGFNINTGAFSGAKFTMSSTTAVSNILGSFTVNGTSTLANAVIANLSFGSYSGILKATNGLVGTSTVDLLNDTSGVLSIVKGGTGTTTAPTFGQLLIGNALGGYDLVATSTLGLASSVSLSALTSSLTNGSASRWNGSSFLNSIIRDDGTVAGINATSSLYSFNLQGSAGTNPFNVASSTGTSLLTVLANGNVGISSTTPSYKLAVSGDTWFGGNMITTGTSTAANLYATGAVSGRKTFYAGIDDTVNTTLASTSPYVSTAAVSGAWGAVSYSSLEMINAGFQFRIRQTGTVSSITLKVGNKTPLSSFKLRIWRKVGSYYNLVGESEELVSRLQSNQMNTIALTSPITGVQEGDYYGYRSVGLDQAFFYGTGLGSQAWAIRGEEEASPTQFDWASKTSFANFYVPIMIQMTSPNVVYIGDSITQGRPYNSAYTQYAVTDNNLSTYWGRLLGDMMGWTYQNMGNGGNTTAEMAARFNTDVVNANPRFVVILGGANDLIQNVSEATTIANLKSMIDSALANRITPIFVKILPATSDWYSNATSSKRDRINADVGLYAAQRGAYVVESDNYFGQFRAAGDAGNLWDIKTAYQYDGLHLSNSGSAVLAQAIYDSITGTFNTYGKTVLASNGGFVGIGTSTPTSLLSVVGTTTTSGLSVGSLSGLLWGSGGVISAISTSSLGFVSTSTLAALTSSSTNGFVPRWNGTAFLNSLILDDGTVAGINATSSLYSFNVQGSAGTNPFNVASSSGTSLFTVLANGNVGIGTTTSSSKLAVAGQAYADYFTAGRDITSTFYTTTMSNLTIGALTSATAFPNNKASTGFVDMTNNVVLYHLNDSGTPLADSSGNSYSAIGNGSLTYGNAGEIGNAVGFNGATSLTLPQTFQYQAMTVSMWIKSTSTTQNFNLVDSQNAGYKGWSIGDCGGVLRAFYLTGGGYSYNGQNCTRGVSRTSYADGNWHNIVAVFVGGSYDALYFDGTYISGGASGAMASSTAAATVGATYTGLIDEFAIWNKALSAQEIAAIYDNQKNVASGGNGSLTVNGDITFSAPLSVSNGGTGFRSAATGTIFFGNGTSALSTSSSLFWDNTNNRLGIGTSSPLSSLYIHGSSSQTTYGASTVSNQGISLINTSSAVNTPFGLQFGGKTGYTYGGIFGLMSSSTSGTLGDISLALRASTSATVFTEAMRIKNNGLVGIGTSSPDYLLTIASSTGNAALSIDAATSTLDYSSIYFRNQNAWANPASIRSSYWTTPGMTFTAPRDLAGRGFAFNSNAGSTHVFIDTSTGNVGMGTTSPATKLHVVGGARIDAGTNYFRYAGDSNDGSTVTNILQRGRGTVGAPTAVTSANGLGTIEFGGYDGSIWTDGWNGGVAISAYTSENWSAGAHGTELRFSTTPNTATNTVERMRIMNDGKVGIGVTSPSYKLHVAGDIGATAFTNTSNRDSKKNIVYLSDSDMDNLMNQLYLVKPAQYNYKIDEEGEPTRFGLIAEDAPEILLGHDGKSIDLYKMATFALTGVKINFEDIKEIKIKLENFISSLASLESRVTALEVKMASTTPATSNSFNSASAISGFNMLDEVTGKTYCVKMSDGILKNTNGACESATDESNVVVTSQHIDNDENASSTSAASSTPEIIYPVATSTNNVSTSTTDIIDTSPDAEVSTSTEVTVTPPAEPVTELVEPAQEPTPSTEPVSEPVVEPVIEPVVEPVAPAVPEPEQTTVVTPPAE